MKPLVCRMRLQIWRDDKAFGPGVAELLERVDAAGSLKSACAQMGIAYSNAWRILRRAQEQLGFPLLESHAGGKPGGNSALTEEGRAFLLAYRAFAREAAESVQVLFQKHFPQNSGTP